MSNLEMIRQREQAATPGTWEQIGDSIEHNLGEVIAVEDLPRYAYPEMQMGCVVGDNLPGDLPFIAHAREDIPYLLDLVDRAKPHMECISDDGDLEPEDLWLVQEWLDEVRGEADHE